MSIREALENAPPKTGYVFKPTPTRMGLMQKEFEKVLDRVNELTEMVNVLTSEIEKLKKSGASKNTVSRNVSQTKKTVEADKADNNKEE